MIKQCLIGACLLALGACGHSGGKMVTDAQVDAFVDGRTTISEVIGALGPPTTDVQSTEGRTLGYSFSSTHLNGATYVPIVGMFAGGASGQSRTVIFQFDTAGILHRHTVMSSHFGS
jgi:hypothetical protein